MQKKLCFTSLQYKGKKKTGDSTRTTCLSEVKLLLCKLMPVRHPSQSASHSHSTSVKKEGQAAQDCFTDNQMSMKEQITAVCVSSSKTNKSTSEDKTKQLYEGRTRTEICLVLRCAFKESCSLPTPLSMDTESLLNTLKNS